MPQVSVVIPAHNCSRYICQAIDSVLAQTFKDHEIIVVDDGSTDGTARALEPYLSHIHYVYQANRGRSVARNLGIAQATGNFIAFLDADDTWHSSKLELQLAELGRHSEARWIYCMARVMTRDSAPMESDFWPDCLGTGVPDRRRAFEALLLCRLEIYTSTILVQRDLLMNSGGFEEALAVAEDTNLWIRLASVSPPVFLSEVLVSYRADTEQIAQYRDRDRQSAVHGLQAIVRSVEKLGLDPHTCPLARQGLCSAYLNSALIEFGAGNCDIASHYWHQGMALANSTSFHKDIAAQMAYFALAAARYHAEGPLLAERILADLLVEVPFSAKSRETVRRIAYAEFYAAVSFMYAAKGQTRLANRYARKALFAGPTHRLNLGLWKRMLPVAKLTSRKGEGWY